MPVAEESMYSGTGLGGSELYLMGKPLDCVLTFVAPDNVMEATNGRKQSQVLPSCEPHKPQ